MQKMKAIVAKGYGSPDVLEYKEVDRPQPKANEVLVKVVATTVTQADTMMRTGKPYFGRLIIGLTKPKYPIPGTGFAGIIEQVGEDVTRFVVGDEVFGETTTHFSTNAEYVAVAEEGVILKKPEALTYEDAATFADGPLTSLNFLKLIAEVKPGQKVLVNGASGSLGTAAVQLAKQMGAEVTGVCSGRNIGLVKSLGADHVVDYNRKDFTKSEEKFDVIYDTVGKSNFRDARRALIKDGQFISPVLQLPLLMASLKTSFSGNQKAKFAATGIKSDAELRPLLAELVNIYLDGDLKVVIDRQYPLAKVAEAHRYVGSGRKKGNVVIITY